MNGKRVSGVIVQTVEKGNRCCLRYRTEKNGGKSVVTESGKTMICDVVQRRDPLFNAAREHPLLREAFAKVAEEDGKSLKNTPSFSVAQVKLDEFECKAVAEYEAKMDFPRLSATVLDPKADKHAAFSALSKYFASIQNAFLGRECQRRSDADAPVRPQAEKYLRAVLQNNKRAELLELDALKEENAENLKVLEKLVSNVELLADEDVLADANKVLGKGEKKGLCACVPIIILQNIYKYIYIYIYIYYMEAVI
jgi:hypothetical protein